VRLVIPHEQGSVPMEQNVVSGLNETWRLPRPPCPPARRPRFWLAVCVEEVDWAPGDERIL
jgi:hypothetical protein